MSYEIKDLIAASIEDDAHEFKKALSSVLKDKINDAVGEYKVAVAGSLFNTEEEQIDELDYNTLKSYRDKAEKGGAEAWNNKDRKTEDKRQKGFAKATMRMQGVSPKTLHKFAKEEQIDELSTGTIRSYMKKATKDSAEARGDLKTKEKYLSKRKKGDLEDRIGKRKTGINRAINSLMGGKRKEVMGKFDEEYIKEDWDKMPHEAKELVLHGDNDSQLEYSSKQPIHRNLARKHKKGVYDHEKAKKLWSYHADRAAQSYAKQHGDGTPWHKMFSTAHRKAAAAHWADMHHDNMKHGIYEETIDEVDKETLKSYMDKAAPQVGTLALKVAGKKASAKEKRKFGNRFNGVALAKKNFDDPNYYDND